LTGDAAARILFRSPREGLPLSERRRLVRRIPNAPVLR
jgi:hypothetical protein